MRIPSSLLLFLGAFCMVLALGYQNTTMATEDYRAVLLVALGCMAVADICCAILYARGGVLRRVTLTLAAPSMLILLDDVRRLPYAFGWAD